MPYVSGWQILRRDCRQAMYSEQIDRYESEARGSHPAILVVAALVAVVLAAPIALLGAVMWALFVAADLALNRRR